MTARVQIEKHPSERRRPAATTLYCGCSCCCCCCLHTIGSLVGAVVAPVIGAEHEAQAHWTASFLMPAYFEDEPIKVEPVDAVSSQHSNAITPEAPSPTRQPAMISAGEPMPDIRRSFGVSSVALFWWLTCILTLVGVPLTMGLSGFGYFWGIAIIILLCFPGIQLVSALLTAIIYGIWERPDQDYQLRQVGKIALGVLAGCGLGMGAMIGIGLLLSLR